jgi:hypothetical protein
VGHAETELAIVAVLEAEHVVAHDVPASGLLPEFGRVEGGQEHFLGADGVHFLAHDANDLVEGTLREEQIAVDAGDELPDVAGADQEFVGDDFSVGGIFPESRNEKLAPLHRIFRNERLGGVGCGIASPRRAKRR